MINDAPGLPSTVLVTGVTGFLGGATAADLLTGPPSCRLLLLARGRRGQAAGARVRQSLARFMAPECLEAAFHRVELIEGDLTEPTTFADQRFDRVTHVLHLAANTSFRAVQPVRQVNLDGTLALARRMSRASGLRRFLYVGTAYICGPSPPPVVHEDDFPQPDLRHLVEYTASKAECETRLEGVSDLPWVVARPSVVVGHTELGCAPSASIFWYYRTLYLLRRLPAPPDRRKDIVPVDYAAKALVLLLLKPALSHRRYHISAGELSSVSWQNMMATFESCDKYRSSEPCRVVDFATVCREQDRFRDALGVGDERLLLYAMEGYFRFSASSVGVFDNSRLLGEGMPPPPPFTDYLGICASRPPDRGVYDQMRDDF